MPRHLILGTAGHIDHGKTSLVKALTGIDTDRLPEEKARGITIDIGFASLDLGDVKLGIVDVPGHERFIKNMLAGATGIDLALLVVAADDGVMRQTREHLEILKLLGVQHGVIALTKSDLVDDETRQIVELELRELVTGSFLESAPVIPTSVTLNRGIDELKTALTELCKHSTTLESAFPFRLPIDRCFVLQGHGTIVTGSVINGVVRVGDELDWHHEGTRERVRVRSLSNHGQPVEELQRGMRGAINLAGVPHNLVRRGQELAAVDSLVPSRVVTVELHVSRDSRRPAKHRLPVRFHIGTAEVMAAVSLLEQDSLAPGASGLAQLFLEEPVTAAWGQHFVLRDSSAEETLGGGRILQPSPRKLRRRQNETLDQLRRLASTSESERADAAIWFAGFDGCPPRELQRLSGAATPHGLDQERLIHASRIQELDDRILKCLADLHHDEPLLTNHDRGKVVQTFQDVPAELLNSVINRLIARNSLVGDARRLARADFKPKLSINLQKLKDRIVADHFAAGLAPPEPAAFANLAAGNAKSLNEIYEVAVAEKLLVKITPEIYLHAAVAEKMMATIQQRMKGKPATVAEIRDWLGTTRKYAVPICEYLDRMGITVRNGDLRRLV